MLYVLLALIAEAVLEMNKNKRTNGTVNAHLISGPRIYIYMMFGKGQGDLIYLHLLI